jgi:hypothetical protein
MRRSPLTIDVLHTHSEFEQRTKGLTNFLHTPVDPGSVRRMLHYERQVVDGLKGRCKFKPSSRFRKASGYEFKHGSPFLMNQPGPQQIIIDRSIIFQAQVDSERRRLRNQAHLPFSWINPALSVFSSTHPSSSMPPPETARSNRSAKKCIITVTTTQTNHHPLLSPAQPKKSSVQRCRSCTVQVLNKHLQRTTAPVCCGVIKELTGVAVLGR